MKNWTKLQKADLIITILIIIGIIVDFFHR